MPNTIAIITPVYRTPRTEAEQLSLSQLRRHLGHYRRIIIAPPGLQLAEFADFEVVRFPARFFHSVRAYNKLMLSRRFYEAFAAHEQMLIYQLDALVFRDELVRWCDAPFDFIGAPVFDPEQPPDVIGMNGGFSLRRVGPCLRVLEGGTKSDAAKIANSMPFMERNVLTRLLKRLLLKLHLRGVVNVIPLLVLRSGYHEDMFWSRFAPLFDREFRVAPASEAKKFAFEAQPSRLYAENQQQLPFGCHAWERWDPQFWTSVLKENDHAPSNQPVT